MGSVRRVLVVLAVALLGLAAPVFASERWHKDVASYYDDAGTHCCGVYAHYGVADCGPWGYCYRQGTKIQFCWRRRCVIATVDDHGPYVAGRAWDLNEPAARAVGLIQSGRGYAAMSWRRVRR